MVYSSLITSSILGGQLATTTFPPLEKFQQRMKFTHKFTVNNLVNKIKKFECH